MRKILFAIFMAFMLTACATKPTFQVQDKEVRYEKIPAHLTETITPDKPKPKAEYMGLKPHERESYLSDYSNHLLGVVKEQNIKLKKIDKLNGQLK